MKRRTRFITAVAVLALAASACGGEAVDDGAGGTDGQNPTDDGADGTEPATTGDGEDPPPDENAAGSSLTVAYSIGPITFNPHVAQPGPQYGHLEAVYDTFVRIGPDGELEPGLATEWEFADDGLALTMTLRSGVVFHDGEVFDADAAKANIEQASSLDGARTVLLDPVDGVDVVDDETIVIRLTEPAPTLPQDLGSMVGMVVSPNLLGTEGVDGTAAGTGAYVYDRERSVPGDRYEFVAFDEYWDETATGRPDRITLLVMTDPDARLNALRSGQLDGAMIEASQVESAEGAGLAVSSFPDRFWGILLQDRAGEMVPELGITEVRQAMNHAVDRDAIVEALFFGRGSVTNQLWNSADSHYSTEVSDRYPYDPDRARALLEEAGVDGFSFSAPFLPFMSSYAQAVQEFLRVVGIELEIEIIEPGTLGAEARSGDWAASGMIAGGTESAAVDTGLFIAPNAIYNTFGTQDPVLDDVIEAARVETDRERRSELYQEVSAFVTDDAWFLMTHYADAMVAHDPLISGWNFRFDGSGVPVYRDLRQN